MKIAILNGVVRNAAAEYDDCERLSRETGAALVDVLRAAERAAAQIFPPGAPDPGEEAEEN